MVLYVTLLLVLRNNFEKTRFINKLVIKEPLNLQVKI